MAVLQMRRDLDRRVDGSEFAPPRRELPKPHAARVQRIWLSSIDSAANPTVTSTKKNRINLPEIKHPRVFSKLRR